jgi:hypothetical protein
MCYVHADRKLGVTRILFLTKIHYISDNLAHFMKLGYLVCVFYTIQTKEYICCIL